MDICLPRHPRARICFLLFFFSLLFSQASAKSLLPDTHGFNFYYGQSGWTNIGPADRDDEYEWMSLSYQGQWRLSPWFSLELMAGPGFVTTDHHGESPTVETRLRVGLVWKHLFVKLGGGLAHIFDDENLPGLARSDIHCIVTGAAGIRFTFDREENSPVVLELGYGVEHLSVADKNGDDGDDGWNTGRAVVSLIWPF